MKLHYFGGKKKIKLKYQEIEEQSGFRAANNKKMRWPKPFHLFCH